MATRLRGDKDQFWNNIAVLANGTSNAVDLGRGIEHIVLFVTASAATTISVQVAHTGDITSQGILPDDAPSTWFDLFRSDTGTAVSFAVGPGSRALIVNDLAVMHMRLLSSAAATITAGWLGA